MNKRSTVSEKILNEKNQVNDLKTIKPTTLSVPSSTKNSFDLALKCIVKMGMRVYYYQVIKIF